MFDGAELGQALAARPSDLEGALTTYEADLFPRSTAVAAQTDRNLKLFFGNNAPQSVVDLFSEHLSID